MGYSSALIAGGNTVHVLMWAMRSAPSNLPRLYSTTASGFGSNVEAIDPAQPQYANFGTGQRMSGFATSESAVYAYMGTSASAYALSLKCTPDAGAGGSSSSGTGGSLEGGSPAANPADSGSPGGCGCECAARAPSAGWLGLMGLGLIGLGRRRRHLRVWREKGITDGDALARDRAYESAQDLPEPLGLLARDGGRRAP